jgi:hypothetical protein
MLASSEQSVVLLINPQFAGLASVPAPFRRRFEKSYSLLRHVVQVSGVSIRLLGAIDDAAASFTSLPNCQVVVGDPVIFWRDQDMIHRLGSPETQVLYCGGAWLDEDVLVAALSAAQIGYDTRVLVGVSVARTQFDQASASDRLVQHGVLIATVRQTVLEWSLAAADDEIGQQLRDTLHLHQ